MRSLRLKFSFFRSLRCWDRVRYPLDMVGNPWGAACPSSSHPRNMVLLHLSMKRACWAAPRLWGREGGRGYRNMARTDRWRALQVLGSLLSERWSAVHFLFLPRGDICGIPDRGTCCVNSDTSVVTRLPAGDWAVTLLESSRPNRRQLTASWQGGE